MKREELLYIKLVEECAEVQKRALKLLQFGPDEREPKDGVLMPRNIECLTFEIEDLMSVILLLGFCGPTTEQVKAKEQKIAHFADYSQQLGILE